MRSVTATISGSSASIASMIAAPALAGGTNSMLALALVASIASLRRSNTGTSR